MRPNELSSDRGGVFAGDDPFAIARRWLEEAEETEPNDHNAMALATVDGDGLPNVRMVLLKDVRDDSFVFFTNYHSQKAAEVDVAGVASFVIHWKSLRRQIRVRGTVDRVDEAASDAYFGTRSIYSRIGAWASRQSAPLQHRGVLEDRSRVLAEELGENPGRPPFWGGFQITPLEIEFWSDGEARLHDRFRWLRFHASGEWQINRLNP